MNNLFGDNKEIVLFESQKLDIEKEVSQEVENYKKFAFNQNLLGLAVAMILATSVSQVVSSISNGLLMPLLNYLTNATGTDWRTMTFTPVAGMTFEVGTFLGAILNFFVISITLYVVYVKIARQKMPINKILKK